MQYPASPDDSDIIPQYNYLYPNLEVFAIFLTVSVSIGRLCYWICLVICPNEGRREDILDSRRKRSVTKLEVRGESESSQS